MSAREQRRIDRASNWYLAEQLDFDSRLIAYHYRTIQPYLRGPRGLELGPAEGRMTRLLAERFKSLTVVEGSARLLDHIRPTSNLIKVHSLFEDFRPTERFDSIVMNRILEHVVSPVSLLRSARRWLAPKGRIFVGVPNALSFHRLVAVHMGLLQRPDQLNARDRSLGHRRVYTKAALIGDLRRARLRVTKVGGIFFKPLSNQQIEDTWTPEMMDGFFELGKEFQDHAAEIFAICRAE